MGVQIMDRNAPASFVFKPSISHPMYYQDKKGSQMIDLGLSLRTLQSDSRDDPSGECMFQLVTRFCSFMLFSDHQFSHNLIQKFWCHSNALRHLGF